MSFRGLVLAVVVYWLLLAGVQAKKKKKRLEDESASPPSADKTLAMHHHQRGTMAHMQGDLVGAIEAFRSAIQAKPEFAYAYYRLGFVQHELRQANPKRANEDPVPAFKAALALNPWDEMSHYSFGQALQDDERIAEAIAVFKGITSKINSKSAQAYWSLGKLLARGVDEFDSDSDPNAPDDPSLLFEQAARLNPMNFNSDGTRVRPVELRTPERSNSARSVRSRSVGSASWTRCTRANTALSTPTSSEMRVPAKHDHRLFRCWSTRKAQYSAALSHDCALSGSRSSIPR